MSPYIFRAEQLVARPLPEVFEFFSRAENLQRAHSRLAPLSHPECASRTCAERNFDQYALRWRLFPIHWTTEIVE
jgi:hypothetical protein